MRQYEIINNFLSDDYVGIRGKIELLAKATGGDGYHIKRNECKDFMKSSPRQIRQDLERIYIALKACGQYEGVVREGFDNLAAVLNKGIEELKQSLYKQSNHKIENATTMEIADHDNLEYDNSPVSEALTKKAEKDLTEEV